jgi:hypothetical protein
MDVRTFKMSFVVHLHCAILFTSRENRYVLFLTENYAALDILMNPKNYLGEGLNFVATHHHGSVEHGGESEAQSALFHAMPASDVQPFILFGSSFPKDKEYTQVIIGVMIDTL